MKNSGKFQNSMRAVTINSEFSLSGLIICNNNHDCKVNINKEGLVHGDHWKYYVTFLALGLYWST